MNDKITVIVTLYNRLEYARNMILALQQQTKQIDELIFADDGSSEKLMDFIADLLVDCKFNIKHVYQDDIGFRLARSRNNGAREASGDYLIFLPVFFLNKFYFFLPNNKISSLYKLASFNFSTLSLSGPSLIIYSLPS